MKRCLRLISDLSKTWQLLQAHRYRRLKECEDVVCDSFFILVEKNLDELGGEAVLEIVIRVVHNFGSCFKHIVVEN